MSLQISQTAGLISVNTTSQKSLDLPLTSQRQGRVLTIKDTIGLAAVNPITINAIGGDTFEDGTTTLVIRQSFGSITLISKGTVWYKTSELAQALPSTLQGLGTLGYLSTPSLVSTVRGLGTAGYLSSINILNLVSTPFFTSSLTSTVEGLGTVGYVSTATLASTLTSTLNGLSNVAVTRLIAGTAVSLSPANGIGAVTINVQGVTTSIGNYGQGGAGSRITVPLAGPFPYELVTATIRTGGNPIQVIATGDAENTTNGGWGVMQLYRGTTAIGGQINFEGSAGSENSPFGITWIDAQPAGTYTYALKINSLTGGDYRFGETTAPVITAVELAGASPGYISTPTLVSTVEGLGTIAYVSTLSLTSTVRGLGTTGYLSSVNLSNLVSTPYLDTTLASTVRGLGTTGYLSSVNLSNLVSTPYLDTTLASTVRGLGTTGYLSSINLSNLVSTPYLDTTLASTVEGLAIFGYLGVPEFISSLEGLGTYGYLSSIPPTYISTPTLDLSLQSTVAGLGEIYLSTAIGDVTTKALVSTVEGLGTTGYLSSIVLSNYGGELLYLNYSVVLATTFNELGNRPTTSIYSDVMTTIPTGSSNLISVFQTDFPLPSFLPGGIWTMNIFASSDSDNTSIYFDVYSRTPGGIFTQIASGSNAAMPMSNGSISLVSINVNVPYTNIAADDTIVCNLVGTNPNILNAIVHTYYEGIYYSHLHTTFGAFSPTPYLISSIEGLGTFGYISTPTLNLSFLSTVAGLGTTGYLSSVSFSNLVSTPFLNTSLASTVAGLGTTGYLSSVSFSNLVSTPFLNTSLASTVQGLGTAGYLSTTSLLSTVQGLATIGYVSSTQLTSTSFGLTSNVSTLFSTLIQGLPTNFGGEVLYLNYSVSIGPYQQLANTTTTAPTSSVPVNINSLSSNVLTSFRTDFVLPPFIPSGLWDMSIWAQASRNDHLYLWFDVYTLTGVTETLVASGVNNDVLLTTTLTDKNVTLTLPYTDLNGVDAIVVKVVGSNTDNQTRSITTNYEGSNYSHIHTTFGTLLPASLLTSTVTGLGTAGYVSTLQLQSTVQGLGTYGYLSSIPITYISTPTLDLSLQSTVAGLGEIYLSTGGGGSGDVTKQELISTTEGLGTAGYISASQFQDIIINLASYFGYVSSPSLASTVEGLATSGYISTPTLDLAFQSTVANLGQIYLSTGGGGSGDVTKQDLISTTEGLATLGYVSVTQLLYVLDNLTTLYGYVSTLSLDSALQSTVANLGQIYISTGGGGGGGDVTKTELISTVEGLGTSGYLSSFTAGADTQVLYNNSGTITGSSNLTFTGTQLVTYDQYITNTLDLRGQVIYPQPNGLSINENVDNGTYNYTAYNFASGNSAKDTVLTLGHTTFFTNMIGIVGDSFSNTIVLASEALSNTAFEFRQGVGLGGSLNLTSGNLLFSISNDGQPYIPKIQSNTQSHTLYYDTGTGLITYAAPGGGGGGVTSDDLVSTVTGIGTVGYLSTLTSTFVTMFTSTLQIGPPEFYASTAQFEFDCLGSGRFSNLVSTGVIVAGAQYLGIQFG